MTNQRKMTTNGNTLHALERKVDRAAKAYDASVKDATFDAALFRAWEDVQMRCASYRDEHNYQNHLKESR